VTCGQTNITSQFINEHSSLT